MDRSKRHLLIIRTLIPAAAVAVALSSCHKDPTFGVEGTIDGADDLAVTVEKSDYSGRWQPIDSTRTDSKGRFSLEIGAPSAPEIYRVGIGDGKWVYIPVDSTETITISAPLKGFDTSFTLSGSDQAVKMGEFDKALIALGSNPSAERLEAFRRDVYTRYLQDSRGSVMSYYVLTKTLDGRPLFDPTDPNGGSRYFIAVANAFKQFKPEDPHTMLLERTALNAVRSRKSGKAPQRVLEAQEIGYIDIELPDEKGNNVKLSEVAGNCRPTVVVFSLMTPREAPALHRELASLRNSRGGNLNIYHVCFDQDQFDWREGALNLPWTTVYDPNGPSSPTLASYNVTNLPTFFIIDGQGRLVARCEDTKALASRLSSL